jgi:hypothetical protein
MAEMILVRQHDMEVTEAEREAARKVMFGFVDGLGEKGRKQWRRLWNGLLKLEPGEMVSIVTHQERLGWYHRKHMALESKLFEAQERFDNFKHFRDWLKIGAGHCDWYPGPKGGVFPVPKSTSYAKMEQAEMEVFHAHAVEFLRTDHAGKTLWKHLDTPGRIEMLEGILGGFGE